MMNEKEFSDARPECGIRVSIDTQLIVKDDRRLYTGFVPYCIQRLSKILEGKSMRDDAPNIHFPTFQVLNRARQAPHLRKRPGPPPSARVSTYIPS